MKNKRKRGNENLFDFEKKHIAEVIEIAKNGNKIISGFAYNYIIKKYGGMVHGIINRNNLYIQGGEREDLVQEGYTGLYKAIRDYKSEHGSFENFAKVVIRRHLITAIKKATRLKNKPLNEMYSFDKALPDNDNLTMMDIIGFKDEVLDRSSLDHLDPEEIFILRETQKLQKDHLEAVLSEKEMAVYKLYVEKKKYPEIMEELGISSAKEVDNTIQRIKRKYREVLLFDADNLEIIDSKKQKIN